MANQSQFSTMFGLVLVVVSGLLSMTAVTASTSHSIKLDVQVGTSQQHTANVVEVGDSLRSERHLINVVNGVVGTNSDQAQRVESTAMRGLQTARRLIVSNSQAAAQIVDKPADDENCMLGVCPSDAKAETPAASTDWAPGDPNCILGFC